MCGTTKEGLEKYVCVVSSEVYQLQQQKKPLSALRAKHLRVKLMICTKFVDCIHENQALEKKGRGVNSNALFLDMYSPYIYIPPL